MKKILLYTVLGLVLAASTGSVQAQTTLTLEQARSQAITNNKKLASAKTQVEKLNYDVKAMKANFFPNFKAHALDFYNTGKYSFAPMINNYLLTPYLTAGSNYVAGVLQKFQATITPTQAMLITEEQQALFEELKAQGSSLSQYKLADDAVDMKIGNVFSGGITMYQPIYMGGKIINGYKMTKIGQEMANTNVRLTESEVILSTDEAYVLCIKAKELGEVAKSYKALLEELKKNVDGAIRHGMKTHNDALKVEVKLNEAELNIVKADNALRLAQMNLAQVIGLPLTEKIDVSTDGLYTVQTIEDKNGDISSRPEVSILADKTEMARRNVNVVRADFLPNLVFGANCTYFNGMKLMDERLLKKFNGTVGVVLQIPLYHFGEGRNKVNSAKAEYHIAQLEEEELKEKMQLEQMQAYNNVTEAATEIKITEKSVESAYANMNTSKQQYEVGTEPLSDYLEAQTLWQQASAQAVEARCQYFIAHSKYLKACGDLNK